MGKIIKKQIFLDELPKWKIGGGNVKSGSINWKESVGYKVKFIYDNIEGEVEIVDYIDKYLYIKYKNKELFKISSGHFQECQIGRLLGKRTDQFKVEIGQIFKDDKRDLTIIDRKIFAINRKNGYIEKQKYYKYKCNKCGFECGEHYRNGEYEKELWISEGNLLSGNNGCACCGTSPQIAVPHINSIVTNPETHWMVKYFQGGYEEAKKYTFGSNKKIFSVCPDCGRIKNKDIRINTIYSNKSINCSCGDGIKYPEKLMFNILEQIGLNFKTQLNKTDFKWCDKYKYDFFFEYNNEQYIIETHGGQHPNTKYYNGGFEALGGKSYEEELQNDNIKKELALSNGIKEENYIVIDCSKSDVEFIKNEVLDSKLKELFDLYIINWSQCEDFALSNRVKEACKFKMDNPEYSTADIAKIMKINSNTVCKYLKQGTKLGWCNYDPKEEIRKTLFKNGFKSPNSKPVEIFKDGVSLGVFESRSELLRQSEEMFGVKLIGISISDVCTGKYKQHKGFTFKYITQ